MSPYSAFAYNVLNIGIIFPWVYVTTLAYWPDANVPLGILITGGFTALLAVVYAGLASAMPRTGGDYVFQSRTLKPWLGFAIVSTMIITFFVQWQALGGWLTATLGLSPLFTGLGLSLNNAQMLNWGIWFGTPVGIFATSVVASTIAAAVLIKSFRLFVQAQWVMWYGFLISFVLMVAMFLATPTSTFIQNFNHAAATISPGIGGGTTDYYHFVTQDAIKNGFTPVGGVSLASTLFILPVALTSLGWVGYAQEQAGEIQGASSLKNQFFINVGAGLFSTVCMMILAYALLSAVGQGWYASASYENNLGVLPFAPYFAGIAAVLTNNPILVFLMIIGILLNAIQVVFNVIIGWTRVALAMSMDGVLPRALSAVSDRTHTPVVAHVVFLVLGGGIMSYVYNFVPGYTGYTLAVTLVATLLYIGTALGGAIFPKVRKEVYNSSPIAKYKVAGVPLITICGVIAALFSAWMLYYYVAVPQLAASSTLSLEIVSGIFVTWLAYYFIRRAWLRRVGINLDLAFKEVPPA
jgi:amino acid transporter